MKFTIPLKTWKKTNWTSVWGNLTCQRGSKVVSSRKKKTFILKDVPEVTTLQPRWWPTFRKTCTLIEPLGKSKRCVYWMHVEDDTVTVCLPRLLQYSIHSPSLHQVISGGYKLAEHWFTWCQIVFAVCSCKSLQQLACPLFRVSRSCLFPTTFPASSLWFLVRPPRPCWLGWQSKPEHHCNLLVSKSCFWVLICQPLQ